MSKKFKDSEADMQNALAITVGDDFQDVELQRRWYKAVDNGCPLVGIVLRRSDNVRPLFKSDYGQNDPLFAYAIELRQPIPKASGSLVQGTEAIAGMVGDVVYFFEQPILKNAMLVAMTEGFPIAIFPGEKRQIKSRKHGIMVNARQWRAKLLQRRVEAINEARLLSMPSLQDEGALLPPAGVVSSMTDGTVIDTEGESVPDALRTS